MGDTSKEKYNIIITFEVGQKQTTFEDVVLGETNKPAGIWVPHSRYC